MHTKELSTYLLFPHLTSTGCLGGEGVRQCTLVWGINFLDKSEHSLMHFDKFYIMCETVLVTSFTVKLTKPWTPEIFMERYYVARNKPIRHKITKLQTAMVISLWFWGLLAYPELYVIGQYTINIPETFQVFTFFWVSH